MHVISARLLRESRVLLINAYFTIAFTLKFSRHSHMNYFINDGLRGHNRSRFEINDKKLAFLEFADRFRKTEKSRFFCFFLIFSLFRKKTHFTAKEAVGTLANVRSVCAARNRISGKISFHSFYEKLSEIIWLCTFNQQLMRCSRNVCE